MHARGAAGLFAIDLGMWAVVAAAAYLLVEVAFGGEDHQNLLVVAILWALVRWRLLMLLLDMVLRPGVPAYRLIDMSDGAARQVKRIAGAATLIGIFSTSVMPVLLRAGLPMAAGQVVLLAQGIVVAAGCALALWRYRASRSAPPRSASIWTALVASGIAGLWIAWTVSVLLLEFSAYHAFTWSMRIGALAYMIEIGRASCRERV